ncbi:MAG: hypothetical protein VX642_11220 [Bdellovibrionota bacterium]|nr:hypothetical protein [Bdellovibrionota bacterium]
MKLGIEYFPHLNGIEKEVENISHFQITIPTLNSFRDFENLALPLVVHSNLLNAFGDNNWHYIKLFRESIQKLNPIAVIEHGALGFENGQKNGISSCDWQDDKLLSNIKKWEDILGHQVILENPPYQNISEIHKILEFSKKNDVEIACDIPHLIMTSAASGLSRIEFEKVLRDWNPLHRHVGGLKICNDLLLDAHSVFNGWMLDVVQKNLSDGYTTLEQSEVWQKNAIKANLNKKPGSYKTALENIFSSNLHIMGEEEYNEYLANERSKELGMDKFTRRFDDKFLIEFELYDYFTPFFALSNSVLIEMKGGDIESISKLFTRLYQLCSGLDSWIGKNNRYYLEYTSNDENLFLDMKTEEELGEVSDKCVYFTKNLGEVSKISFGIYN